MKRIERLTGIITFLQSRNYSPIERLVEKFGVSERTIYRDLVSLHEIGGIDDAVLNHPQAATRGGVLGVYQRATRWPEQVAAMQTWGRILEQAIAGTGPERNVAQLVRQHAG